METNVDREGWRERRGEKRFETEADTVLVFLEDGLELSGRVEDLSLSGCRIWLAAEIPERIGGRVEVAFCVNSQGLRFSGVVLRADGRQMGVRFDAPGERRRAELAEVIAELAAMRQLQPDSANGSVAGWTESLAQNAPSDAMGLDRAHLNQVERRGHPRQKTDLTAALYLVGSDEKINGRLMNLSLSGCRICTETPPPAAFAQVEAAFYHLGMPFRVAGVIQAIHGPCEVGVHFLEVTERNRVRLLGLIGELREEDRQRRCGEKSF